jgi:hypothetical protein
LKQIRKRLTYANVMSSLAVFLILGGATAFAAIKKVGANEIKANSIKTGKIVKEAVTAGKLKNGAVGESKIGDGAVTTNKLADNAVTTPKIANDAVTGDKVKESTLGEVPSAATAVTAVTAANLQAPEAFHVIGAAGQPGFENGFANFGGTFETAGFYRDRQCRVWLRGVVSGNPGTAFTLPVGFRPPESTFTAVPATAEHGNAQISTTGQVTLGAAAGVKNFGLTGVSFRVAGC